MGSLQDAVRTAVAEADARADAARTAAVADAIAAVQKEAEAVRTKAVEKTAKQASAPEPFCGGARACVCGGGSGRGRV